MQTLDQIAGELQNFIEQNRDHVETLMNAMNAEATPAALIAAYAGIGPAFAAQIAEGAAEFSGIDGQPAGPDKVSKWLQTAADLILTGKGVREAALGKKGSNPQPSPVNIQPVKNADQKIFGLPKGLFALVVLVVVLIITLTAIKAAKAK